MRLEPLAPNEVRAVLADAGLITTRGTGSLIRRIRDYVASFRPQSIEGDVKIDPLIGIPTGFGGKISLGDPSSDESARGIVSVTSLLRKVDHALSEAAISCWALFDRLDVAFQESRELEINALRSLFHVYQDMKALARRPQDLSSQRHTEGDYQNGVAGGQSHH